MAITNDLAIKVDDCIKSKGIRKTFIANKLGISQQLLNKLMSKENFTIEDANRILSVLDCHIQYQIVKND